MGKTTTRSLIQTAILTLFASQSNSAPTIAHRAATPAPEVDTNPVGSTFTATLPAGAGVQGSLSGAANDDGHGTTWEASFTNLPPIGGPFCAFPFTPPPTLRNPVANHVLQYGTSTPVLSLQMVTVQEPEAT